MKFINKALLGVSVLLLMITGSAPVGVLAQDVVNPNSVFDITLLTPNSNPNRISWSKLIAEELPKAGINVADNQIVGWDVIGPRTFSYDAKPETGIPDYANDGYDVLFVGLSGSLDYDPTGSYSSETLSPAGNNFAFYMNDNLDALMKTYASTLDSTARNKVAKDIQAILYEDVPYIPIVNTAAQWAWDADMTLTDNDLLYLGTSNWQDHWRTVSNPNTKDLIYAHTYELTEFMPNELQSYIAAQYMAPIFVGLYERDENGFNPLLAVGQPVWNTDNTEATVEIRTDATFSNGNPVTADDIVNSFKIQYANSTASKILGGYSPYISTADGYEVVDATHVKFTFDQPYFGAMGIISSAIITDDDVVGTYDDIVANSINGTAWNDEPLTYGIGAGPYKYKSIDKVASNVVLEKRTDYWGGAISSDTISFNKYTTDGAVEAAKAGVVHIIDGQANFDSAQLESETSVKLGSVADFGTQFLTVNMGHPLLGTGEDTPLGKSDPTKAADAAKYLRQAIAHLIPRDDIITNILKGRGTPGTSLWPDVADGYDTSLTPYTYDVAKAIELIEMAGYTISYPEATSSEDNGSPYSFLFGLIAFFALIPIIRRKM